MVALWFGADVGMTKVVWLCDEFGPRGGIVLYSDAMHSMRSIAQSIHHDGLGNQCFFFGIQCHWMRCMMLITVVCACDVKHVVSATKDREVSARTGSLETSPLLGFMGT